MNRANAIKQALVERGVDAARLETLGAGEKQPVAKNDTPEGQALNRRVELVRLDMKPNIVFIMGDDIGWSNIGVYNQGIMSGRTPNLDRLATEGMRFTDYYAEASCTAGRANFITGELPIRTGLTTVGQAGAPSECLMRNRTIATVLKSWAMPPAIRQEPSGRPESSLLPTVHGFDEFFGYLYHLDAMEDPCHPNYQQKGLKDKVGPRNMIHWLGNGCRRPNRARPAGERSASKRLRMPAPLCPDSDGNSG